MSLEQTTCNGVHVIKLSGHLDTATSGNYEYPLVEAIESCALPVVIDLSGITYMSSEGLRLLIVAAKKAEKHGLPIIYASPSPMVMQLLKISMFTKILKIVPSLEEAVGNLT